MTRSLPLWPMPITVFAVAKHPLGPLSGDSQRTFCFAAEAPTMALLSRLIVCSPRFTTPQVRSSGSLLLCCDLGVHLGQAMIEDGDVLFTSMAGNYRVYSPECSRIHATLLFLPAIWAPYCFPSFPDVLRPSFVELLSHEKTARRF